MQRIQLLDNQLANQIAAGEVVERPASVVKELLENSIDAQATRVEIDVERGGTRLIRIIDDGLGIHEQDLPLALSRHATSKIGSFDDLCAVETMGFRGEALASIASVSKLLLRSRRHEQKQGWQATAEGREMKVTVKPVAATAGTCIEVRDLFFNTPARRKFLRTERTEYMHIEDTVKRQALANPQVAMVLKHNGKVIKRFPAASSSESMSAKITAATSRKFLTSAMSFRSQLDELVIHGWLGSPDYHRSESDGQFIFINQRPVKDRLLSHAIRQSYSDKLPAGRFASYIIYIECPASEVDVNVHPTKHEVRFRQPRQVHDFLVALIEQCLNESSPDQNFGTPSVVDLNTTTHLNRATNVTSETTTTTARQSSHFPSYQPSNTGSQGYDYSKAAGKASISDSSALDNLTKLTELSGSLTERLVEERYQVISSNNQLSLVDLWWGFIYSFQQSWLNNYHRQILTGEILATGLLIPKTLSVAKPEQLEDPSVFERLKSIGIDISAAGPTQVMVRKLPNTVVTLPFEYWQIIFDELIAATVNNNDSETIIEELTHQLLHGKSFKIFVENNTSAFLHEQKDNMVGSWQALGVTWQHFARSFSRAEINSKFSDRELSFQSNKPLVDRQQLVNKKVD
ncbi:MAG: DNA mismatch repair endonuclease MutL [Kangiellaceae bacterium]|jgi:DNA mismatch repair protein MutL|nr:DNA mismatch repair endonuclease MutL [Kangiellaceae bacterium]